MMLGASQLLINSVLPPHNVGKKTTLRTSPRIRAAFTRSIFIAVYGFFYEILFSEILPEQSTFFSIVLVQMRPVISAKHFQPKPTGWWSQASLLEKLVKIG